MTWYASDEMYLWLVANAVKFSWEKKKKTYSRNWAIVFYFVLVVRNNAGFCNNPQLFYLKKHCIQMCNYDFHISLLHLSILTMGLFPYNYKCYCEVVRISYIIHLLSQSESYTGGYPTVLAGINKRSTEWLVWAVRAHTVVQTKKI